MTLTAPKCPKCRSAMERGYVLDNTDGGGRAQSTWIAGEPERSLWWGLKLKGRELVPLASFRCSKCWYVEFYAPPA